MSDDSQSRRSGAADAITGSVLLFVGAAAGWQAYGFDAESRPFPLVVAGLLAMAGLSILLTAGRRSAGDRFARAEGSLAASLAVAAIAAWGLALAGGAGFVMPTFCLQLVMLSITGIRGRVALPAIAAAVTAAAYLLFVVLLEIPLPPSRLPPPLEGW